MWLTRLSLFEDNKYYEEGGKFNVYQGTTQLPNCTCYGKLRISEMVEENSPTSIFKGRSATGFPEAKNWYNETTLPKGTELREGCAIIFDGVSGHIAICEKKLSPTRAIISQSQWTKDKSIRDYRYWETKEVDLIVGKATIQGVGNLLGFIYPSINDVRVSRNSNEQIEIIEDRVNARVKPEGELFSKGLYIPQGIYNVSNKKVVNDYTWYQIDNVWVREGSWLKYYAKEEAKNYEKLYKNLLKDIKEVVKRYE